MRLRGFVTDPTYVAGNLLIVNSGVDEWSRYYLDHPRKAQTFPLPGDTIIDYDDKIDAAMVLRDEDLPRAYYDTPERLLARRTLPTGNGTDNFAVLAYAQATPGHSAAARASLAKMLELARNTNSTTYPTLQIGSDRVASVHTRMREPVNATAWLTAGLQSFCTIPSYASHPRLGPLRKTPVWQEFVKSHPVQAY